MTQTFTLNAQGVSQPLSLTLPAGSYPFSVAYAGNTNMSGSSANTTFTVNKDTPSMAVSSTANPSAAGLGVTFTASATPSYAAVPLGSATVTFSDGAIPLGTVSVTQQPPTSAGTIPSAASLAVALMAGSHSITATFNGNSNFNSNSATIVQTIISKCDLNADGAITVADVQRIVGEALGTAAFVDDLNADGRITVADIQTEINAVLFGCAVS